MDWSPGLTAIPDTGPGPVRRVGGSGARTWALSAHVEALLAAGQSGGLLGAAVVNQPVGTATPLHLHTREAEAFFLLEGEKTYRAAEETFLVEAGDFVWLPAGIPHAFRVTGAG